VSFKDMYFSAVEKDDAKAVVLTFLRQRAKAAADKPDGYDNEAAVPVTTPANQPHTSLLFTGSGLWEDYDNYTPSDPELTNSDVPLLDTELDNYLREPRIPCSANIYAYWHSRQFPGLEPTARKYLSAPPTSVASEQLFSAADQIYSDRCSNLM